MSGLNLYDQLENLTAMVDSRDLCRTDEERREWEAEIDRLIETYFRKLDNLNRYFAHLESQAELATKEIERLKMRKAAFENMQERLEQYVIRVMQRHNLRKLEGDTSTLTLRVNTPGVEIDDVELVPPQFKTIRQEVVVDKRGIKKAIDNGESVTGVHLRQPTITLLRK